MTATWGAPTYESRCHLQLSQAKQLLHSTLKNLSPQQRPHGAAAITAFATAALPCRSPSARQTKMFKGGPMGYVLVVVPIWYIVHRASDVYHESMTLIMTFGCPSTEFWSMPVDKVYMPDAFCPAGPCLLGPQRSKIAEKVHKPPLGVNVINFELNGFNASIWVP